MRTAEVRLGEVAVRVRVHHETFRGVQEFDEEPEVITKRGDVLGAQKILG